MTRETAATSRHLPILHLAGAGRDVGEAHGRLAASAVARNVDLYFRRFAGEAELPRDEVVRRAGMYWAELRAQAPEFADMISGIATGAGQPLLDVVAINLRFEFLYGEFSRQGQQELAPRRAAARECTAFAVEPAAARDGHLRIGQNWDWIPDVEGLMLHVTRPDGLRVLCFTEAGIAGGKIGMNSAGVGLNVNGLLSDRDDWAQMGRPFHVRTWDVLCSASLEEAVTAVSDGARSCSANFLVAQAGPGHSGRAVDVEAAPHAVCQIAPTDGVLAHTNHFLGADELGVWQPIVEEKRSTFHRCDRIQKLLAEARGTDGIDDTALRRVLSDHDEFPNSVCKHPDQAKPEVERYQTVISTIMDLHAGSMLVAAGPPCEHAYHEFLL